MKNSEVLIEEALRIFDDLIGRFGEHAVAAGKEVYTQPYVYLSMHLVEMRTAGWRDVDFDRIAAVSGASALFAYEPGRFEPKYANLSIGMDKRIADATGFGYEWLEFGDAEEAWKIVKESIDSGRPVKGWHWENLLFAGYQDAEEKVDRRIFAMADGPDTIAKWWTWKEFREWADRWYRSLGRHTKRVPEVSPRRVALRVMSDLVNWAEKPPEKVQERYPKATFGLAGIEKYAADCANLEKYEDWLACHDINPQWTVRNSTAVYLQEVAKSGLFTEEVSQHIEDAAGEYRAAYEEWRKLYELLGHGASETDRRTRKRREAGAAAVRRALEHEKAGIETIKATLALIEEDF